MIAFRIYNDVTHYPFLRVLVLGEWIPGDVAQRDTFYWWTIRLHGRLVREKLLESRRLSWVPGIRLPLRTEFNLAVEPVEKHFIIAYP